MRRHQHGRGKTKALRRWCRLPEAKEKNEKAAYAAGKDERSEPGIGLTEEKPEKSRVEEGVDPVEGKLSIRVMATVLGMTQPFENEVTQKKE